MDTDEEVLDAALALLREKLPDAATATFQTSDQNIGYGFLLLSVWTAAGLPVQVTSELEDEVYDFVCDINWDGVMGEDVHGYVTIPLPAAKASPPVNVWVSPLDDTGESLRTW